MSGPFKMKGSEHLGYGNQKRKDGMPFKQYLDMAKKAKDTIPEGEGNPPGKYASPAKGKVHTHPHPEEKKEKKQVDVSKNKKGKSNARNYGGNLQWN